MTGEAVFCGRGGGGGTSGQGVGVRNLGGVDVVGPTNPVEEYCPIKKDAADSLRMMNRKKKKKFWKGGEKRKEKPLERSAGQEEYEPQYRAKRSRYEILEVKVCKGKKKAATLGGGNKKGSFAAKNVTKIQLKIRRSFRREERIYLGG